MIPDPLPRVSGIILSGGQSRRMGRNKAFIEFEGAPLIARVIERVSAVCTEVILVTNNPDEYAHILRHTEKNVQTVGDVYLGKGSLGGIYSGLQAAHEEYALVVACDMPFLNVELLRFLISLAPQADVVVPRAIDPSSNPAHEGKKMWRDGKILARAKDLHPTHAVYAKTCLAPMQAQLLADDLRIISFFEAVRVRVIEPAEVDRFDPQHLSFFNANTLDDLRAALAWVHKSA